ncbi:unnamed protein product [Rotaria magnacalcarata]|uniref:F-box domain-containing protein n=1 Tax=Rotaria magnacalcarata TaxID=392030 RepID=A0A815FPX4_9BILA|nr:unnamed protein product [Rotaria magnacalcarata]CAF1612163.1 unnamed protein product [Rotaria magnacalcarata]CAF2036336.1 unnamed protein product [Rotaria magnacalcarata]CAF3995135.1 unnamed protein product [Rotaria magnacalcarata]CAF4053123.1 unnamed protein product [Rotaria magnacalcarata]
MQEANQVKLSQRITTLEDLSAELFFELFDFFHFTELSNTFAHLNQRIDAYLAQSPNIYLDLLSTKHKLVTKFNDHQLQCVKSLKLMIFKEEKQHEKHEAFFIQYPIRLFQQLHSLNLRLIISATDLRSVIDQLPLLPSLIFLNITFDLYESKLTMDDLRHACKTIFLSCTKLKTLNFALMDHTEQRRRTHNAPLFNQPITSHLEYLDIYQLYFDEFDCILSSLFLPQIKSLTATIYDNPVQRDFPNEKLTFDFLTNLVVHFNWEFTFTYLESIFKRTPNLKSFIITSSSITIIDGPKWQYFLSKYLLKVIKFHLHASDWEQRNWLMRNEYTDFQTSTYWRRERNGNVHMGCQETLDEEGTGINSKSVTFTLVKVKTWTKKCLYCYCE